MQIAIDFDKGTATMTTSDDLRAGPLAGVRIIELAGLHRSPHLFFDEFFYRHFNPALSCLRELYASLAFDYPMKSRLIRFRL